MVELNGEEYAFSRYRGDIRLTVRYILAVLVCCIYSFTLGSDMI